MTSRTDARSGSHSHVIHSWVELALLLDGPRTVDYLLAGVLQETGPENVLALANLMKTSGQYVDQDTIEDFAGFAESEDVFQPIDGPSPKQEYLVDLSSLLNLLAGARYMSTAITHLRTLEDHGDSEFVCTLPENDSAFEDYDPVDFGFGQITSRLLNLCARAEDRIIILSPFLEREGIEWLLPGLRAALRRGVDIDLLSKQLGLGTPNERALGPLVELDQSTELDGQIRIYDYYEPGSGTSDYPLFTLHSKLVIIDDNSAYIGSANLTSNAFTRYLEIGVIVQAREINDMVNLIEFILNHGAKQVFPEGT